MKRFQVYSILTTLSVCSLFADQSEEMQNLTVPNYTDQANYNDNNSIAMTSAMRSSSCPTTITTSRQPVVCCEMDDPCIIVPSQPCPDLWRLSGSWLYLLPTVDDTYFVIDSNTATVFPNGKRKNNEFDFHSGFRVGAEYAICKYHRELQADYTYFTTHNRRTVSGDNLWATVGRSDLVSAFENYSGFARSRLHLMYQRADFNFSQRAINNKGVYFYFQPGVEYAYLRLTEHYRYESATDLGIIEQKSRTLGFGPQLGFAMDYNFYEGCFCRRGRQALSFTALFSGSILMSRARARESNVLNAVTLLEVRDRRTWRTIPAFHARAGFSYTIRGSWAGFSVGASYEFNTYVRALTRVIFPDDVADGQNFTNYYNFDIQGLNVTAALSF